MTAYDGTVDVLPRDYGGTSGASFDLVQWAYGSPVYFEFNEPVRFDGVYVGQIWVSAEVGEFCRAVFGSLTADVAHVSCGDVFQRACARFDGVYVGSGVRYTGRLTLTLDAYCATKIPLIRDASTGEDIRLVCELLVGGGRVPGDVVGAEVDLRPQAQARLVFRIRVLGDVEMLP